MSIGLKLKIQRLKCLDMISTKRLAKLVAGRRNGLEEWMGPNKAECSVIEAGETKSRHRVRCLGEVSREEVVEFSLGMFQCI